MLVTHGLLLVHVSLSDLATCLLRVLAHGVFKLARMTLSRSAMCRILTLTHVVFLTSSVPFPGFAMCHFHVKPRAQHDLYTCPFLIGPRVRFSFSCMSVSDHHVFET